MKKHLYLRLISLVALLSAALPAAANRTITITKVYDFSGEPYGWYSDGYYSQDPLTEEENTNWRGVNFEQYSDQLIGEGNNADNIYLETIESIPGRVTKVTIEAKAWTNEGWVWMNVNGGDDEEIRSTGQYDMDAISYEDYVFNNPTDNGGYLKISFSLSTYARIYIRSITVEYETEAPPEPYAVLSEGVLTFCYDNEKDTKEWMSIGPFDNGSDRGWYDQRENITKVVFDDSFANYTSLTSTFSWFDQCKNLATIEGINNLKTDNVENMRSMFEACSSLTNLDLSNFNTAKVTDFANMFAGCSSLTNLNISIFDTGNAVNMRFMFPSCSSLESLDLRCFNTANVTDMHGMFNGCANLQKIYVSSNWTTTSITDSEDMFNECINIIGDAGTTYIASQTDAGYAHIDEGQTNPGYLSVINEPYAVLSEGKTVLTFYYDHLKKDRGGLSVGPFSSYTEQWGGGSSGTITTVVFEPSFANCTSITSTAKWFYLLYKLTAINGIEYLNTTNVTDMSYMFDGCSSLTSLDVSGFDTQNVTNMESMFSSCSSLTSLDVSTFDTRNVTNMAYMFSGCSSITSLDVSHFDTKNVTDFRAMFRNCTNLSDIYCDKSWVKEYVESNGMFSSCTNLYGYDASRDSYYAIIYAKPYADGGYFTSTSRIGVDDSESETYAVLSEDNTTLTFYFDNQKQTRNGMSVEAFSSPENRGWKNVASSITTAVFDLSFAYCQTLTSTSYLFEGCSNLAEISNLKFLMMNKVTTMNDMFKGCTSLTNLDVSSFKTNNVTDMSGLFSECSKLMEVDLTKFKTDNVTTMNGMFNGCSSLISLNLSSFKTDNLTDMSSMFAGCMDLRELDLSSFNTSIVTAINGMFNGCSRLKTIYVGSEWFSTAVVPAGNEMFKDCTVLVGGSGTTYDADHIDATYAHIDGGTDNPGYLTDATATRPEPYAVLSEGNTKLTFYYDTLKGDRGGGMSIGPFYGTYSRDWNGNCSLITDVVFDTSFANYTGLTDTDYWLTNCSKLTTITGIENLRTNNVTTMRSMFSGCSSLTDLDLSSLNTAKVTNMYGMFDGCSSLTNLDVSNLNTANVNNMGYMFKGCSSLTSIYLSNFKTDKVTIMYHMFEGCSGLTNLDVSNFNTVKVTDMSSMFSNCSNLPTLDVSGLNTANVTNMGQMFKGCSSLTSIDLSNFITDNVTDMQGMFGNCTGLTNIDLSSFKTGNVTNMESLFSGCVGLTSLDLSNFITTNVTSMGSMFSGCSNLSSLNLTSFNTSEVTSMSSIFYNCSSLTELDFSSFNTDNVTDMTSMFYGCSGLTSIDLSSFKTDKVTSFSTMFYGCSSLTSLDLSSFKTDKVTNMYYVFTDCSNLRTIYVSDDWTTDAVRFSLYMFSGCTSLVGGAGTTYDGNHIDAEYAHIDGGTSNPGYLTRDTDRQPYAVLSENNTILTFYYDNQKTSNGGMDIGPFNTMLDRGWDTNASDITSVVFDASFANCTTLTSTAYWFTGFFNLTTITGIKYLKTDNVTDMNNMFWECIHLTSIDLSKFNTVNVTDMTQMFSDCSDLTSLDLSGFNTVNVTKMGAMFNACSSLTNLDLSSFNTANVTSMSNMFKGCSSMTDLNLSNFNTANVTLMDGMFSGCSSLTSLDVSNFNTANVTSMYNSFSGGMFKGCSSLTSLDLSSFNTEKITNMSYLFQGCSNLTSLDISSFNTTNVTTMYDMFYGCSSLTNLDVTSFNTANVTDMGNMFYGCSGLTNLTLDNFNTANVTSMGGMFSGCSSLTNLTLDNFNTASVTNMGDMFNGCSSLTNLDLSGFNTINVTIMAGMFFSCNKLTSIDMSGFNTDNLTSMRYMFFGCTKLTSIDVSDFNTANVTNMASMWLGCYSLTSLDLSSFNTGNVTDMSNMFQNCSGLTTIIVDKGWNTDAVASNTSMFLGCIHLVGGAGTEYSEDHIDATYAHIDGGKSNPGYFTEKGPEAYAVLTDNEHVIYINEVPINGKTLTFYYDKNKTEREGMSVGPFETWTDRGWNDDRESITTVEFDTSFAECTTLKSTAYWFEGCTNLTLFSGLDNLKTDNVEDMTCMFSNCFYLRYLDISGFNTGKVTSMMGMFYDCNFLETIFVGEKWNTDNLTNLGGISMFSVCDRLVGGQGTKYADNYINDHTYAHIDEGTSNPGYFTDIKSPYPYAVISDENTKVTFYYDAKRKERNGIWLLYWHKYSESITQVIFDGSFAEYKDLPDLECWFAGCSKLTSIEGFSNLNTEKVTNMRGMFINCSSLTTLDLSSLNTSNVTTMAQMFQGCSNLESLNISFENTGEVITMQNMFGDCSKLKNLNLSNFNTAKLEVMSNLFSGCSNLESLDISFENTGKVIYMQNVFEGCSKLKSLDLSSFNTENVTHMSGMFSECSSLTDLDLSNFMTNKVEDMSNMFKDCSGLATIYVSSLWNTEAVTESTDMFSGCTNIKGGAGTHYDPDHTDKEYARIDDPDNSKPGYFTKAGKLGDVNGDGFVNIADAQAMVSYILGTYEGTFNLSLADMNYDGVIDIFDVTLVVNITLEDDTNNPSGSRAFSRGDNSQAEMIRLKAEANNIYLSIDEAERLTAFQFDITLPEGVELTGVELAAGTTDHMLKFVKHRGNRYRVVGLSFTNELLATSDGKLIMLQVSNAVSENDVSINNVLFVTPSNKVATHIGGIEYNQQAEDDTIYNLSGQKLNVKRQQLSKGVYIINHKKVIIK